MVGLAAIGNVVAGLEGREVAVVVGETVAFFFLAGGGYATSRIFFALAARRRARRSGVGDPRYRKLARHATLHNSSLLFQLAIAGLALYLALPWTTFSGNCEVGGFGPVSRLASRCRRWLLSGGGVRTSPSEAY
jgi:hypothetical protein